MSIPKVILLSFYALGSILAVARIGKPRNPSTPADTAWTLVMVGILAWLVVIA